MKVTELESIPGLAIFIDLKKMLSIRGIGTSSSGRCKLYTLAHAFKSGFELFTPIAPAVLLTMDSHLSFSNWKGVSVKVVRSQALSLFYVRKF